LGRTALPGIESSTIYLSGIRPVARVELAPVPAELAAAIHSTATEPAGIELARNCPIRVWDAHSMARLVRPNASSAKAAAKASAEVSAKTTAEAISIKKPAVDKKPMATPTEAPAPATPTAPTREQPTDINTRSEPESKTKSRRIPQVRIRAPNGRPPYVCGLVHRNVDHLRIGRLNFDRALSVGRYHLLRSR
jgi:hypothetical protein